MHTTHEYCSYVDEHGRSEFGLCVIYMCVPNMHHAAKQRQTKSIYSI